MTKSGLSAGAVMREPCGDAVPSAQRPVRPFASPSDHLQAELGRIDLLLRSYASTVRDARRRSDGAGLWVADGEVDRLLDTPLDTPGWRADLAPDRADALARAERTLADDRTIRYVRGETLRLCELRRRFLLDQQAVDILLIALAPALLPRVGRLIAWLQDDLTRRTMSADLAQAIVAGSFAESVSARANLRPGAPLLRWRLLRVDEGSGALSVEPRLIAHLLGADEPDDRIAPCLQWFAPDTEPRGRTGPGVDAFIAQAMAMQMLDDPALLLLRGDAGAGKRSWAAALCRRLGNPLLAVDGATLAELRGDAFADVVQLALREARLADAAILWRGIDPLLAPDRLQDRAALLRALTEHPGLALCAGGTETPLPDKSTTPLVPIDIPLPDAAERLTCWRNLVGEAIQPEVAAILPELAARFRQTPGGIREAAAAAWRTASWRDSATPRLTLDDLRDACRSGASTELGVSARRTRPRRDWRELVLPADAMRQLREICMRVRHDAQVMEGWGFAERLAARPGLSALFSGPSGAGKTLAAEILAAELGVDLYTADLSALVSKYIGETEKNLAQLFAAAARTNAILFFDEADALFGKRAEVRDAHDRYANLETSYLLQRMETHAGITVLATNLRRNMDEAFTRRLAFHIQFPAPEVAERLRIWRGAFPRDVPLADEIDFVFLAAHFRLSGGNIRNVTLAAAFLAAADSGRVGMPHLLQAIRRELQKLGKSAAPEEFGRYSTMLEE